MRAGRMPPHHFSARYKALLLRAWFAEVFKIVDADEIALLRDEVRELRAELRAERAALRTLVKSKQNTMPALALRVAKLEREAAAQRAKAASSLKALIG